VVLAVVAAGAFPNLAVKHPSKKKLEVNGGKVDAGPHAQSIVKVRGEDDSKGGGKGGKGKIGKGKGLTEWLCYSEITQVEQRYSMTNVSRVSPVALMLLCGDDPVEVQGAGEDVSVSLLDGWAEFLMPRDQAEKLQNLRYALRQSFLAYCDAPAKAKAHVATLESAVALLEAAMDDSGRPVPMAKGYSPKVPPYEKGAHATALEDLGALQREKKPVPERYLAQAARTQPPKEESAMQTVQNLVQQRFKTNMQWAFEQGEPNCHWRATLKISSQGLSFTGVWSLGKKGAQLSAAKSCLDALRAEEATKETEAADDLVDFQGSDETEGHAAAVDEEDLVDLGDFDEGEVGDADLVDMEGFEEEAELKVPDEDLDGADEPDGEESADEVGGVAGLLDGEAEGQACDDEMDGVVSSGAEEEDEIELFAEDAEGAAALRFMQGDLNYKDATAQDEGYVEDDLGVVSTAKRSKKRRRVV